MQSTYLDLTVTFGYTLSGDFDLIYRIIAILVRALSRRFVVWCGLMATKLSWTHRHSHPDGGTAVHHYASIKRLFTVELI